MEKPKLVSLEEKRHTLSNPRRRLAENISNLNREIQKIEARYLELGGDPKELETWPKHRKQLIVSVIPALLAILIFYVLCSVPELPYILSAWEYKLIIDAVGLFIVAAVLLPAIMFRWHFPLSTMEGGGMWETFKLANRHVRACEERSFVKSNLGWYATTRESRRKQKKIASWQIPKR